MERWLQSIHDLERALNSLGEILDIPLHATEYVLDATVHRFEFTYELFWKTLRYLLIYDGQVGINSPREVFKAAYKRGWIHDEDVWLESDHTLQLFHNFM